MSVQRSFSSGSGDAFASSTALSTSILAVLSSCCQTYKVSFTVGTAPKHIQTLSSCSVATPQSSMYRCRPRIGSCVLRILCTSSRVRYVVPGSDILQTCACKPPCEAKHEENVRMPAIAIRHKLQKKRSIPIHRPLPSMLHRMTNSDNVHPIHLSPISDPTCPRTVPTPTHL